MKTGYDPTPKATTELEQNSVVAQFDMLFDAVQTEEASDGDSPVKAKVESENQLRRHVQILPDGVSLVEVGDDTLKERKSISVNLAHLLEVNPAEHLDDLNAVILAKMAEEMGLAPELVKQLEGISDKLDAARHGKETFFKRAEETGYYRGSYETSGDPWLFIKETTKKDGTVLMGALLGGTLTNHVSLSHASDTDDLWNDGMTTHAAVRVPLEKAMQLVQERMA